MERRVSPRIAVGYKAEIIYNGKSCECVIENLSATGANIVAVITHVTVDFKPQEMLDLRFTPHADELLTLQCRVAWISNTKPHNLTTRIGLELVNPSWEQCLYFV